MTSILTSQQKSSFRKNNVIL